MSRGFFVVRLRKHPRLLVSKPESLNLTLSTIRTLGGEAYENAQCPSFLADLLELLQSWWRGDTPLGAVVMSIIMAGLRIAYFGGGGGWKRKTLEILLCGALTLTFASALEYVGWPKSLSVAIGGGVGLIGVDAIRGAAMRVIGNKFGAHKE